MEGNAEVEEGKVEGGKGDDEDSKRKDKNE
jgi:hypothetical protein